MRVCFIIFIMSLMFNVYSQNFTVYTKSISSVDLNRGTCENSQDSTQFIIRDGRFSHITETLTSTYVMIGDVTTFNLDGCQVQSVVVRSEVGNYYIYTFDLANKKVFAYSPKGGFITEFDTYTP